MNVKSLGPQIVQPPTVKKSEGTTRTTLKESVDRDANGRQDQGQEEPKRHLKDEEFQEALQILKDLPGVKQSNLVVRVESRDDHRIIFIEDIKGHVVRRLSEADLWAVTRDKSKATGQIYDKAM